MDPPAALTRSAAALFDLSRGRQALLSVAQPALGAMLAIGGLPDGRTIAIGLAAATAGYLAVFSLNDVLDVKADRGALRVGSAAGGAESYDLDVAFLRHPLARGDITLAFSIAWVGGLGSLAAVLAWVLSPVCLALFGLSVALEAAYCALRSVTWLKTLVSGLMVGVGGLAGWAAVAPLAPRALPFFGFLALWEIAARNLPNDLADLAADSATGIRTVATTYGGRASAGGTLAGSVACPALGAVMCGGWAGAALAAGLGVLTMLAPAFTLWRLPTPPQAGRYFNRASLYPALLFATLLALLVGGGGLPAGG
ncbi:MAG: UbiA prenyltransferase family protein [Coriobacteriia bacterium]|nr:UbiA prenyltransferase family protein [Coriobacteriia bacterium]